MSNSEATARDRDRMMIGVAKRRGIVRLVDGHLATLVGWGKKQGRAQRCRLESQDGEQRWTARKVDIIEVADL